MNLKLTTPSQVLTARDDMEYWSQKHMAVARGDAVVVTNDGRRLSADTVVAYTVPTTDQPKPGREAGAGADQERARAPGHGGRGEAAGGGGSNGAPEPGRLRRRRPAMKGDAAAGADDPLGASGKLEKVECYGNVVIRTVTDTVTGDRAVYVPDTGIARVAGKVRITRGQNQLAGAEAEVNLKTGISRLLPSKGGRVSGLVVPNDQTNQAIAAPDGSRRRRRRADGPSEHAAGRRNRFRARGRQAEMSDARTEPRPRARTAEQGPAPGRASRRCPPVPDWPRTGVGKTYKKRPVVRNVSISVRRGEAVGLLGPNGAGKTTTFYMIVGLVKPDTGSISMEGADITTLPMYRRARLGIGYLPQEASVFRGLNVEQNVMAALEVVEPDPDKRDRMLDELLAEFGIGHLRRTPALALSGGERRRVEIARALATQPAYILLDEPLAGIDPIAVGEIRDLVSHLKHRGIGVLITDHNVRETLEIIDRAYIMHDGQVLMEGRPEEVVAHEDVRRVYLGERFSL